MAALLSFYKTLTNAGKPFLEQLLRARLKRGKEDPVRIGERMGLAGRTRPDGPLVWVHAASVGEAQSALTLIEALGLIVKDSDTAVTAPRRAAAGGAVIEIEGGNREALAVGGISVDGAAASGATVQGVEAKRTAAPGTVAPRTAVQGTVARRMGAGGDASGRTESGGISVLVTTGTVTSAALMAKRLPPFAFHQFVPVDHPAWVQSFLTHWRPDLALWMESELWPNMLCALKDASVPVVLVNARLSERSFARWSMVKSFAKEIMGCFPLILTQTDKDAEHYRALGAANVVVTDNIKYSAAPLPCDPNSLAAMSLATEGRPVWVYASTHDGEEALACRVHKRLKETIPALLTIIVPRHPERRDDIARTCFEQEVKFRLRGENRALPVSGDDIYIADTLGELGLFYTLCPVAMIGRSFSSDGGGGHNPVEAAQLGCAVLTGPHNRYQRQIYDDMQAASAVVETHSEEELGTILEELLANPVTLQTLQSKAASFVDRKTHVVDTVLERIKPYLDRPGEKNAA